MRTLHSTFLVFFIVAASCLPFFADAATLSVVPSAGQITVGQPFRVDVLLNTEGDSVNAVQGEISYPTNLFSLQTVNDGNSIVSLWINPPEATSSSSVQFAGIIPGGFDGSSGNLVSLIFNSVMTGTGTIFIDNAMVLRNDGEGSPVSGTVMNAALTIASSSGGAISSPINSPITPNPFTPQIASDPNVFGGKYFLVFSTTDKGSGIDHYEVLEGSTWHIAQSPYLLQDQSLSSNIYVRAVDHAGNFIVVEVPARNPKTIHQSNVITFVIFGATALLVVLLFLIWSVRRKKRYW